MTEEARGHTQLYQRQSGLPLQSVQKNKENNLPNLFEKSGSG